MTTRPTSMNSIRHIYKIGVGPSSSHSMGPRRAAELFMRRLPRQPARVSVELYGSLAATGKGHLTDGAIASALGTVEFAAVWKPDEELAAHPNGMVFFAYGSDGAEMDRWQVYSVGGGDLQDDTGPVGEQGLATYPAGSFGQIMDHCLAAGVPLWRYAQEHDVPAMWDHVAEVWQAMSASIHRGLSTSEQLLPGPLGLRRRAASMLTSANDHIGFVRDLNLLSAYALAVSEENAAGAVVVTAPTCGSAGVLPSVLYYSWKHNNTPQIEIHRALVTAGLCGAIVAKRASISGAQVGCQGEIGAACAMAAAAMAQIMGGTIRQIEYAAEMGMEHCLGLTCDPIGGLVQVPCIERNAFGAIRAVECAAYALATDGRHLVSFDDVLDVMSATGRDLQSKYRETAGGGLAAIRRDRLGLD